MSIDPAPLTVEAIRAAAIRLGRDVHRTPQLTSRSLCDAVGADVRCKAEHLQRSGSFKIRGALNRLRRLLPSERLAGVVAFSSGNHAQGVALGAAIEGIRATIVMPNDAPAVKVAATLSYGAEVVRYDRYREDRESVADRLIAERGGVLVAPFDDPDVIAGQGTVGLEVGEDWADVEVAVIPVGGGGLIAGMAVALRALVPRVRIVGVEPAVADDCRQSVAAGRIIRIAPPRTIADGVATTAVGRHTFPIIQTLVDEIVTVGEQEIRDALEFVMTRMKQVVEPTGALTTAALLYGHVPGIAGKRVLSMFCGGNLDLATLAAHSLDVL